MCNTSSALLTSSSPPLLLFFFNAPATTEIYTLSLHDALPISADRAARARIARRCQGRHGSPQQGSRSERQGDRCRVVAQDRKSTRLNSSHPSISYAVFCLKKKKKKKKDEKCDK